MPRFSATVISAIAALGIASASSAGTNELEYVPNSTKKVCPLTGDFDRSAKIPTLSQTRKRFGVEATDLGSSFEHKGKLYFLFGDTVAAPAMRPSDLRLWLGSAIGLAMASAGFRCSMQ